jgi:tetratricopeptide (TPR) repeat protein
MISGMFFRQLITLFLVAGVAAAVPAFGQSTSNIVVDSDVRLFTVMAALNAAGFDIEIASQYHPVRAEVRKFAEGVDPGLLQRLRAFYLSRKGNESDEAQFAKYVSLAVVLTSPPDLRLAFREELLPPDARNVAGFAELAREFYQQARISQRWAELQPQYDAAIDQLGPRIRDTILRTDAYLRIPFGVAAVRTLAIYVELAAPVNSVNVRNYQDDYFVVLGPSNSPQTEDVRHTYLHFQLDSLVARDVTKFKDGPSLLTLIKGVAGVDSRYSGDFRVMATESLIRAIEARIDGVAQDGVRQVLDNHYRSGLLLVPYLYDELMRSEEREDGIREYFGEIASALDVKDEQQRFQQTFHQIRIPEQTPVFRTEAPKAPEPPPADPVRELLKQAEAAFNGGDTETARRAFEKVLADYSRDNGSAFYGLGLIASRDGDSEEAQEYFERTVQSDTAEPSMKVWSYIFLGRIQDLDCNRDRAVEYYRQAIQTGDNTRNAQAAARAGAERPFGDGCR